MRVELFGVLAAGVGGWIAGNNGSGSILDLVLQQGFHDGNR